MQIKDLHHKGINIGLISHNRKEIFEDKFEKLSKISLQMSNLNISHHLKLKNLELK